VVTWFPTQEMPLWVRIRKPLRACKRRVDDDDDEEEEEEEEKKRLNVSCVLALIARFHMLYTPFPQ
jgi:hypothetical protein